MSGNFIGRYVWESLTVMGRASLPHDTCLSLSPKTDVRDTIIHMFNIVYIYIYIIVCLYIYCLYVYLYIFVC